MTKHQARVDRCATETAPDETGCAPGEGPRVAVLTSTVDRSGPALNKRWGGH